MLSVSQARSRVLEAVAPLDVIEVPIAEAAGYVVARDLTAPHGLPRFDNSAMDGYAVVAADVSSASEQEPSVLELIGEARAGGEEGGGSLRVRPGTAMRIMTGAPLPEGANAIAPIEVASESGSRVSVRTPIEEGRHVRRAGTDITEGSIILRGGAELGAGELALLASLGVTPAPVHRRPRVAILVTGDELVAPEREPGPGQIRDSNSLALETLVTDAGAEAHRAPPVPDRRDAVIAAFEHAARNADVVLSSGGVSVGRYDYVKDAVAQLGRIDMWRVAMQPGKPVVFGELGGAHFFGLPGNPVSIHVGFEQFVRPALRRLRGCSHLLRATLRATLTEPLDKSPGRLSFVRVRLTQHEGRWDATPTGHQGSHIQSSLIDCHGVARFGADESHLDAGDEVTIEVWRLPET